jgi:hypothetical protein
MSLQYDVYSNAMSIFETPAHTSLIGASSPVGGAYGSHAQAVFGAPIRDHMTATALRSISTYAGDLPPAGGWNAFLNALELRVTGSRNTLPDGGWDKHVHLFDKNNTSWDISRTGYNIMLVHPPSGVAYSIKNLSGSPGTFGAVWYFDPYPYRPGVPLRLAVKFFSTAASIGTTEEVERIQRMRAVDAARLSALPVRQRDAARQAAGGDEPTPDRVNARVLYDSKGVPCVVMPCMSCTLPHRGGFSINTSMNIIRAVFVDLEYMYERYGLLSCDMKSANVLVDARPERVRVRLADYGGYADLGSEIRSTFPVPWALKVYAHPYTDRNGNLQVDKGLFNIMNEEACVYQLAALFIELVSGFTNLSPLYTDMSYIFASYITDQIQADGTVKLAQTAGFLKHVLASPAWTPDAKQFLEYAIRYRQPSPAYPTGFDSSPPKTLAGLRTVLFPPGTLDPNAPDVVDLTGDGSDEDDVAHGPKRTRAASRA